MSRFSRYIFAIFLLGWSLSATAWTTIDVLSAISCNSSLERDYYKEQLTAYYGPVLEKKEGLFGLKAKTLFMGQRFEKSLSLRALQCFLLEWFLKRLRFKSPKKLARHALHQRGCILMQKTIDGLALMDERWFGLKENMPKFSASECEMAAKGHLFYTSWKFNPLKTLTGLPR